MAGSLDFEIIRESPIMRLFSKWPANEVRLPYRKNLLLFSDRVDQNGYEPRLRRS
jgi:hypothetical protein